jgi:Tol biopolymer transport system component
VKILDFGLAKLVGAFLVDGPTEQLLTRPGEVLGTVGYMSPEQASGADTDPRSDQFSFGSLLYELIAGRRAFRGASAVETLAAIIREEPAPLDTLGRAAPLPLQWILERCLAKQRDARYAATRDLALDLARIRDALPQILEPGRPPAPRRSAAGLAAWIALAAALAAGVGLLAFRRPAPSFTPPGLKFLTHSGADSAPASSPDGRMLAFVSRRDGPPRVWLKQLASGAEIALTTGPDDHPRFAPDSSSLLFTRAEPSGPALYRVSVLGGEPRCVLDQARYGDWSPDGRRLVFVRSERTADNRSLHSIGVAGADGAEPRIVERVAATELLPPRWAPDSRQLAVAHGEGAALRWSILLIDADGPARRRLEPPRAWGNVTPPAWANQGRSLLYGQADSVEGSPAGRLLLQDVRSGSVRTLFKGFDLRGGIVDVAGNGRVALSLHPVQGHLAEMALTAGPGPIRWLTRGSSSSQDRQPWYADAERIVFTSNREGQLDLWEVSTRSGALRRLTDHPAEDWDPRLGRDGQLYWSSKRGGGFEIWTAHADGSEPRPVTRGGFQAENPDVTPDGRWVVFTAGAAARRGIWKTPTDGGQPELLVAGQVGLPELSPDGRLVLFTVFTPPSAALRVVNLADGAPAPFEIQLAPSTSPTGRASGPTNSVVRGRARWTPDGRAIAFIDVDAHGRAGVFVQRFAPGQDTSASRRPLPGPDLDADAESFGFSPDGTRITVSYRRLGSDVVLLEDLAGVER